MSDITPPHTVPHVLATARWTGELAATSATLAVTIAGSKLFVGDAALTQAVEVRTLTEMLTAGGLPAGASRLTGVEVEASSGMFGRASKATYRLGIRVEPLALLPTALEITGGQKNVSLSSITWRYDERDSTISEGLRVAAAAARAKAAAMADALEVELGRLLRSEERTVVEGERPMTAPRSAPTFGAADSDEGVPMMARRRTSIGTELALTELAPPKDLEVEVTVAYAIAP